MNRELALPDIVASTPLERTYSSSRCTHLEAPTPLDRGGISGDLIDLSSTIGSLRAVKETKQGNESRVGPNRHCGKSSVTKTQFFIALNSPRITHAA
jgi:kynurenine formamidase